MTLFLKRGAALIALGLAVALPLPLWAADAPRVPLFELTDSLQADCFWDPLSGILKITQGGHCVDLRMGSPVALFDYASAELVDPPETQTLKPIVTAALADRLRLFFSTLPPPATYKVGAILIDPGHGGKDPGAIGTYSSGGKTKTVREKDIVLTVAKTLYESLKRRYPDKKVLLTRHDDSYPTLEDRVDLANGVKTGPSEAILYVSIHANAAFNAASSGFEVWYLSPDYRRTVIDAAEGDSSDILPILNSMLEEEFTTESILIAKSISESLEAEIGSKSRNRGIKEESWFVVRNAKMPSVLIELGFVSNPGEAKLLADEEYLKKCAGGLYNGLTAFISHFEGSRGFTAAQ